MLMTRLFYVRVREALRESRSLTVRDMICAARLLVSCDLRPWLRLKTTRVVSAFSACFSCFCLFVRVFCFFCSPLPTFTNSFGPRASPGSLYIAVKYRRSRARKAREHQD